MTQDDRLYVRVDQRQKERWIKAARRDGFFENGKPNLSAWLRFVGDLAASIDQKR